MQESYVESLEFSFLLMVEGISPMSGHYFDVDYQDIKSRFKKIGLKLSVRQIEEIILVCFSEFMSNTPLTESKDKRILAKGIRAVRVATLRKLEHSNPDTFNLKTIHETLIIFSLYLKHYKRHIKGLFKKAKHNKYTHAIQNYEAVKNRIIEIFGRDLSKDEYFLLLRSWYSTITLAQNLGAKSNKLKEITKEHKSRFKKLIRLSEDVNDILIAEKAELDQIEHFLELKLSLDDKINNNKKNIEHYKQALQTLNHQNGNGYNEPELVTKALFALFFCAETLGLTYSDVHFENNPFVDLAIVIQGLQELKQKNPRERVIKTHQAYRKQVNHEYDQLLAAAKINRHALDQITNINRSFQKKLCPR